MRNANTAWAPSLGDIHLTEKEKHKKEYLMENLDYWIRSFVRDRNTIRTYRNYYAGVRNDAEFAYLTENFGLGTPSKLNFTNLIKPRIDALIGQTLKEATIFKVACLDDKTISVLEEEKKSKLLTQATQAVDAFVQANMAAGANQDQQQGASALTQSLGKLKDKFGTNYLSDLEIAAQDVLKYFNQSVHMGVKQKLKQMALDLFITGQCYYRVYCETIGSDPILEVIKPENIWVNKNTNDQYEEDSTDAMVRREFWSRKEVIRKLGKYMDKEQKEELFGETTRLSTGRVIRQGIDIESTDMSDEVYRHQKSYSMADTLEVFHVEWKTLTEVKMTQEEIDNNVSADGYQTDVKKTYRTDVYEGWRVGGTVYVNCGKRTISPRSQGTPLDTTFSYGGVSYNDRGGKPFSLVGAMKNLQDIYDLTIFYRDNLIANSGVAGSRINIAGIPKKLGNSFMERLQTHMSLKKNGWELIDPTEQGAHLFQNYGDFDNSVNGSSLQGLENVLQSIEKQADLLAGVNQQVLGQISERDAVTNVKQGIIQTLLINEDMFELLRSNNKRMFTSLLNTAQVAYSKGKKGSYIAGSEAYVFQVNPEQFSLTDFAIDISYSSNDEVKLQTMKELAKEYIAGGLLDPKSLTHIILSDSATEVKEIVDKAWVQQQQTQQAQGEGAQQVEQLQQQIQQLQNELSKAQSQLQSNGNSVDQFKQKELETKQKESSDKMDIERQKLENEKNAKERELQIKQELVQLEREQMYLGTGKVKEVNHGG